MKKEDNFDFPADLAVKYDTSIESKVMWFLSPTCILISTVAKKKFIDLIAIRIYFVQGKNAKDIFE